MADLTVLDPAFDGADATRPRVEVHLEQRIRGVHQPTDLAWIPGREDRVVVLSKTGMAYLATPGRRAQPWFMVDVDAAGELGLLGIAFDPHFERTGVFYVHANPMLGPGEHATRILRGRVNPRTLVDPTVGQVVLQVEQRDVNHAGGQIALGPDGYLYVGLGDGGGVGDPDGNGQDLGSLRGKVLRIDVRGERRYDVPADNPLVGRAGAQPEIWAWGLRNPWRFTFDPLGRLIVADVGEHEREEIDLVAAGDNLGWRVREGDRCFDPPIDCPSAGLVDPIWSYPHVDGIAVTGGHVWTGPGPLAGQYLFGDFGTGRLWALVPPAERGPVAEITALGRFEVSPSAFGQAPDGTVWVADFQRGAVFAIVASPPR